MNVEKFIRVCAIVILALQKVENVLYSNHLGRQTTPPVQTLFLIGNFNIGGGCVSFKGYTLKTLNVGYMGYSLHSCPLIHLPTFPKPFSPFSLYSITVILLGCPLWITPPSCLTHWVEQGILAKSPSAICLFCSSITNTIRILPSSGNQLHIAACYCSPNCQKNMQQISMFACLCLQRLRFSSQWHRLNIIALIFLHVKQTIT